MLFYSLNWSKEKNKDRNNLNRIKVNIKGITSDGQTLVIQKKYDEWVGVCTKNIKQTLKSIKKFFPGIHLTYTKLNNIQYKKILPYFKQRLIKNNKLTSNPKYFYKIYSQNAYVNDIGTVLNKYKISYYSPDDWLVRLYIDLCTKNNSNNFFYMWYNVSNSEMLLESMILNTTCNEIPDIKIASFDLETVPLDGENRVPTGHDEKDQIVMISIIKWSYKFNHDPDKIEKILLYLNPIQTKLNNVPFNAMEFFDEKKMLKTFHELIQDCHILTGYNINNFDLPCLLARIVLLNMNHELKMYSSKKIGTYIVPTFQNKIVIDMYHFIQIFSNFNLPSFKLDVVAKCKLNKSKFPIKATAIHHYYTKPVTLDILSSKDKHFVYNVLKPKNVEVSEFGTFFDCLEYCLEDSMLVYELFKKELVLTFLIERANVTIQTVEQALYFGNTKYILDVFKTYGTCMGYFFNMEFFRNTVEQDLEKYKDFLVFKQNKFTYQGALNFGITSTFFKNVASLDFLSMYPSIVVNHNLSYETSGLIFMDEYLSLSEDIKKDCECIPYRQHSENDFLVHDKFNHDTYSHPKVDMGKDKLIMITYKGEMGFLPSIMNIFLEKRKQIQKQYKQTKEITLYTRQLNIKLFLNSIYGSMASTDFPFAYLDIAMTITCFARLYLLATAEYITQVLGYQTVYGDTDGIFVVNYPYKNCDLVNRYLNQKYMILQFDKIMSHLLIISKKRYIYEQNNEPVPAGFEKKANALTKFMTKTIAKQVFEALKKNETDIGTGWLIWVNTLIQAFSMCINPKTYCITRKAKQLHEYKSTTCPQLKILKKNPSKAGEFIEYTYSAVDIAYSESNKWIMEVEECTEVNFEKLFMSQKKILIDLLNIVFFKSDKAIQLCNQVLNTMKWKSFVNAEITSLRKHKKPIKILVLKSVKYTFELNNCTSF